MPKTNRVVITWLKQNCHKKQTNEREKQESHFLFTFVPMKPVIVCVNIIQMICKKIFFFSFSGEEYKITLREFEHFEVVCVFMWSDLLARKL